MKLRAGYVSEAKVKLALSICLEPGCISCFKCPYYGRGCLAMLTTDALTYITRLEGKVMQFEENKDKP